MKIRSAIAISATALTLGGIAHAQSFHYPPCTNVNGGLSCEQEHKEALENYFANQCHNKVCIWPALVINNTDRSVYIIVDKNGAFAKAPGQDGFYLEPGTRLTNPNFDPIKYLEAHP